MIVVLQGGAMAKVSVKVKDKVFLRQYVEGAYSPLITAYVEVVHDQDQIDLMTMNFERFERVPQRFERIPHGSVAQDKLAIGKQSLMQNGTRSVNGHAKVSHFGGYGHLKLSHLCNHPIFKGMQK